MKNKLERKMNLEKELSKIYITWILYRVCQSKLLFTWKALYILKSLHAILSFGLNSTWQCKNFMCF